MSAATIVRGVSTGASNGTLTGTFLAVTPPAGVVAGDHLLVQITTRDAMTTWRTPAGWTLVSRPAESSGEGFFYRAKYGTDVTGSSWTFDNGAGNTTATKWEWSCVAFKGDQVGDFLTGSAQVQSASSTALATPTIAPAASCHLVAAAGIRITGAPAFTWPAGWVEQTDLQGDPGATNNVAGSIAVYDTTPTAAGSYSVTATSSVASGIGWAGIFAFAAAAPTPVAPVADFTATQTSGTSPLTVQFTDTSTGTPTSWSWTFGDSTTSTAQNPSKTYTTPGTYTVTLTATNAQGSDGETKTGYITVTAPGALPGLIDGVEPEAQSHVPPFVDGNGNLYRITEEYLAAGNNPQMLKSSDGGATWTVVDAAGQMAGSSFNDLEAAWCLQVGTAIVLLFCDDTSIFYATFNTSDAPTSPDTWQVKENGLALGTSSGSRCHVSAVRLSDGRVRAFFLEGPSGANHQTYYATKASALAAGGWSARTAFQPTTSSFIAVMPVVGAADLVHMFFHDYANRQIRYRTLTSAGVLGASVRADSTGTDTNTLNYHAASNAVYYETGGGSSWTTAALYASSSGVRLVSVVDGVVQAEQLVDSNAPLISPVNTAGNTGNDGPQIHLAVQGTTLHAIWTEAASGDLFYASRAHGGAWSTRTRLWDAPAGRAAFWVYSNVYTRGGSTVMGYTYDDGPHADDDSNIYYNELVLAAAAVGRVVDVWNGTALVRRRLDRWNGTALVQQVITP